MISLVVSFEFFIDVELERELVRECVDLYGRGDQQIAGNEIEHTLRGAAESKSRQRAA